MKLRAISVTALLLGMAPFAQAAGDKPKPTLEKADLEFFQKAGEGGLFEETAADLAIHQASASDVKGFAGKLLQEHKKLNQDLKSMGEAKGVSIPAQLNHEQSEMIRMLKGKSGAEFDEAYVDAMVKDHPKDISLFEDRANSSKDPQIKAFAERALPTLREHLNSARGLQKTR